MILELRIENLAVIDRLDVRFDRGLNVLTGETGAGKSIIVGAILLLLGGRASAETVRAGQGRAVVEAVFDVTGLDGVREQLEARGITADDGVVILRRELAAEGRSRAWINGSAVTVAVLGEIGRALADLHGQHEHQSLLASAEQRAILDSFAGERELAERTRLEHARVRELTRRLQELDERKRDLDQRTELLRFQVEEIERAKLRPDEEVELEAEAGRLAHAEEIARRAETLHRELYANEDAVAARLDELRRVLAQLVRLDPARAEATTPLDDAFYALQELGREMGTYASSIAADPARLEQIRRRQDQIFRLKARYGPTLEEVIERGRSARAELETLANMTEARDALGAELAAARAEHARHAAALTAERRRTAGRLDKAMNDVLPELGMPQARFVTELVPLDEPGPNGGETIEFKVSVNAGFEPAPIARVASGGELSRIMLALKATLAREDRVPTLIFDEIDAGVAGRAAHRVAERLRQVAAEHQVFVVTHLAQIAARADHHFLVEKHDRDGRTAATIARLEGEARVREIARLLGGDPESRISLDHARELLAGPPPPPQASPTARPAAARPRTRRR